MPKKLLLYRLKTLAVLSLVWILFGMVFFTNLFKPTSDVGVHVSLFQFCFTFGVIGVIITAVTIFYLKPAFNHLPVWIATLLKLLITVVLFFVIAFVLLMLYFFIHYKKTLEHYFHSFFIKLVYTNAFVIFMIDMGLMTLLTILLLEIADEYGPGMFWAMITGKYHQPKIQNRIFIFLDINESTSIAEALGHERYFLMLRNFFNDITLPILANDGEIYQYVGDEIVISWMNTPENKIKSLRFIRQTFFLLERQGERYLQKYAHQPRFKAGLHAGEVTAGFVGLIKKNLVYSGDTMNTTARIRSMCHELNEPFILSEDFMHDFHQPYGYTIEGLGMLELKGRKEPIQLFSLKLKEDGGSRNR